MAKPTQKHIKVKKTSLRYLYDIAAIPQKTREEFLQKLLRRKNSSEQKNVRLLKIIFVHIGEGIMLEWNEDDICSELNISKAMLYCHKSYLLKGLRLLYFKWKEIEEKEFSDKSKYKDDISLKFAKAEKMFKIGMKKEAKNLLKNIEEILTSKHNKSKENNLLLFNTYKFLCKYYYRKELKSFNYYYLISEKLGKRLVKIDKSLYSIIMTDLYLHIIYKITFYANKKVHSETIHYLKLALAEVKKTNNHNLRAVILTSLCQFYSVSNTTYEQKYINEGLRLSKKLNSNILFYTFKFMELKIKFLAGDIEKEEILSEAKNVMEIIDIERESSSFTQRLLFNMASLLNSVENCKELFNSILYKYNSHEIISNGLDSALRTLFAMKSWYYMDEIAKPVVSIDLKSKKEFIIVQEINELFLRRLDNSIIELIINANKIKDVLFKREFFVAMLFADFWKGEKSSQEFSNHIIKQIDWINRTRAINEINKYPIEVAHWGINLMVDLKYLSKDDLLIKYENKFKYYSGIILETNKGPRLNIYYMLSFIAEQCGITELKDIIKKTFWKIEEKHPEIVKAFINEVKEKENNTLENEVQSSIINTTAA